MISRLRLTTALSILIAGLFLVACGGDSDALTPGQPPTQPATADSPDAGGEDANGNGDGGDTADAPSAPAAPSGTGSGTVVVDGQEYSVSGVLRCEPFFDIEGDLDLISLAEPWTVFVNITTFGPAVSHELSIQGSGGVFSNSGTGVGNEWMDDFDNSLPGAPFEAGSDRIRGGLTLYDAFADANPDTVDVAFDLPIPGSIEDC